MNKYEQRCIWLGIKNLILVYWYLTNSCSNCLKFLILLESICLSLYTNISPEIVRARVGWGSSSLLFFWNTIILESQNYTINELVLPRVKANSVIASVLRSTLYKLASVNITLYTYFNIIKIQWKCSM